MRCKRIREIRLGSVGMCKSILPKTDSTLSGEIHEIVITFIKVSLNSEV